MEYCGVCDVPLTQSDVMVKCNGCDKGLHIGCSTLSANTYKNMSRQSKETWRCGECREKDQILKKRKFTPSSPGGKDKEKEKEIKQEEMIKFIFEMFREFDMQGLNCMIETVLGKIEKMEKELLEKDDEIKNLKMEMEILKKEDNKLKLEIINLPEMKDEKLEERIVNLGARLKTTIKKEDIISVFRLPTKDDRRPVLVKFSREAVKQGLLKARKNEALELEGKKIYINEHLEKETRIRLAKAKAKGREENWKYVWVKNGKIMARKDDSKGSRFIRINKEEDLTLFK